MVRGESPEARLGSGLMSGRREFFQLVRSSDGGVLRNHVSANFCLAGRPAKEGLEEMVMVAALEHC